MFGDDVLRTLDRLDGAYRPGVGPSSSETGHADLDARLRLTFSESPTAGQLASSLQTLDRATRRVATSFERDVPIEGLFGRGRLIAIDRGLVVTEAHPGSLEVLAVLGGLYEFFTSAPVSFVLNVFSVAGYGRAAVRTVRPGHPDEVREIEVARTVRPAAPPPIRPDLIELGEPTATQPPDLPAGYMSVSTAGGPVLLPNRERLEVSMSAPDGSSVEVSSNERPSLRPGL